MAIGHVTMAVCATELVKPVMHRPKKHCLLYIVQPPCPRADRSRPEAGDLDPPTNPEIAKGLVEAAVLRRTGGQCPNDTPRSRYVVTAPELEIAVDHEVRRR
jgi:hypothetical protein